MIRLVKIRLISRIFTIYKTHYEFKRLAFLFVTL